MKPWRLIMTPAARGAWNMAVDEAILDHIGKSQSPSTLRLYAWDPACLSLGHAQLFADVDHARLEARGWDVVRRPTGGRAILHTDELTYSVIGSLEEPVLVGGVLESYNRLAQALMLAVRNLGLAVEMKEAQPVGHVSAMPAAGNVPGTINPVCFEVPSAYEITVNGKKLIGSAQARKKEGVLQHGSLPLTGDLRRICQALVFENETRRENAAQRLLERATTVESALGQRVSWKEAAEAFIHAFELQLGICFEGGEVSESELRRAEELVREKYAHPSWTERV